MNDLSLASSTALTTKPSVFTDRHGHVYTNSVQLAAYFGKRHDHVLRDIDDLLEDSLPNFGEWFMETTYEAGNGQSYRSYNLTRDGFTMLAMGFTGDEAMKFKAAYIQAFNRMESELSKPVQPIVKVSGALLREAQKTVAFITATMELSATSSQAFAASLYERIGIQLALPKITWEPEYTTSELAEELCMNASVLGKRVKELKLDKFGSGRIGTAANGRQVRLWIWNERGRAAIRSMILGTLDDAGDD